MKQKTLDGKSKQVTKKEKETEFIFRARNNPSRPEKRLYNFK